MQNNRIILYIIVILIAQLQCKLRCMVFFNVLSMLGSVSKLVFSDKFANINHLQCGWQQTNCRKFTGSATRPIPHREPFQGIGCQSYP